MGKFGRSKSMPWRLPPPVARKLPLLACGCKSPGVGVRGWRCTAVSWQGRKAAASLTAATGRKGPVARRREIPEGGGGKKHFYRPERCEVEIHDCAMRRATGFHRGAFYGNVTELQDVLRTVGSAVKLGTDLGRRETPPVAPGPRLGFGLGCDFHCSCEQPVHQRVPTCLLTTNPGGKLQITRRRCVCVCVWSGGGLD